MSDARSNASAAVGRRLESVFKRSSATGDVGSLMREVLDIAIEVAGADKGTVQWYDEGGDCLRIVASRGFSDGLLKYFETVHRNTNSSCAAVLTRRMRVVVDDISRSYLFVGTPELDILHRAGVAAVHSTPLITSSGRFWGVFTMHFREPQPASRYDPTPLDQLAIRVADDLAGMVNRPSAI